MFKKVLLYYETMDIIKYTQTIFINPQLFLHMITQINVLKVMAILLILL